jgi:hypothetical protein
MDNVQKPSDSDRSNYLKFHIKFYDENYNAAFYYTVVVVICALRNDDAFTSDYMLSSDWLISNN